MGNGEWGMGNGEWGMGNGEWGMGNGEWGMGNKHLFFPALFVTQSPVTSHQSLITILKMILRFNIS